MLHKKNRLMLGLAGAAVLLNAIIFILAKNVKLSDGMGAHGSVFEMNSILQWAQNGIFLLPIVTLIFAAYCYFTNKEHDYLPWLIILTLTFSSFSIISGSGGSVEFHFSIFMVIAAAAYYDNVRLILLMTLLFILQHVLGFLFFPQLVFGTEHYPLLMVTIHAVFLVLTSSATILQIRSKRQITDQLEAERDSKDSKVRELLGHVQSLSEQIRTTSSNVSETIKQNVRTNKEMKYAFEEVTGGLGTQAWSLEQMGEKLRNIHVSIQSSLHSSELMEENASSTELSVVASHNEAGALLGDMVLIAQSVSKVEDTMVALKQSSRSAEAMIIRIQQMADQTELLALNASIEAARSGEYGRGFEVIAKEIRLLASDSQRAAEEIQDIMSAIRAESDLTASQLESEQDMVRISMGRVESFAKDFDRVKQTIDELLEFIPSMSQMMANIEEDSAGVTSEMSHISAVIEQGMSSMEELMGVCDNQIETVEKVEVEIEQLHELSLSLRQQFSS
ncbi:methyl-accepting chemotaxis protein [Cohnella abietis]|uniref:Methyl-accepting transducer domain-containing protein n=1 Tax=Cohnella abietis TaxID=2507935 RepID=A0A3T1D7G3_9BACL|nr:methyl-accepting chemotaxis protein [Cohnella abietis]BBI34013.1 hypothetical protein KCTCHS21_34120 [Cohnella abietis]